MSEEDKNKRQKTLEVMNKISEVVGPDSFAEWYDFLTEEGAEEMLIDQLTSLVEPPSELECKSSLVNNHRLSSLIIACRRLSSLIVAYRRLLSLVIACYC